MSTADGPQKPSARNFAAFVGSGVTYGLANQLASAAVVYPFICLALGAPLFVSATIYPLFVVTGFVGMIGGPRIPPRIGPHVVLAVLGLVTAALIAGVATLESASQPDLVGLLLLVAALHGLAGGISSVLMLSLMTGALHPRQKSRISMVQLVGSGLLTLGAVVTVDLVDASRHGSVDTALLWVAAAAMTGSAVCCLFVRPTSSTRVTSAPPVGLLAALPQVRTTPWLRQWLVVQAAFLPISIGVGFYSAHLSTFHASTPGALHQFLAYSALGGLGFGLIWIRLRDRVSRRGAYLISAGIALVTAVFCVVMSNQDAKPPPWIAGLILAAAAAAAIAATNTRQSWLLERLDVGTPAIALLCQTYVALSTVLFGVILGVLAHLNSIWPVYVMGAVALLAGMIARRTAERDGPPGSAAVNADAAPALVPGPPRRGA